MPIDNSSLPSWLLPKRASWEAMLEGVQAGSQIRSNQLRTQQLAAQTAQEFERQETAAKIKMMDMSLEKERNGIAVEAYRNKATTEGMRAKALTELNSFISTATAEGKLAEPETLSQLYSIGSKWAPFVDDQTFNGIISHTIKPAQERAEKAKASVAGANDPAKVLEDKYAQSLLAEAEELDFSGFTERAAKKRKQAENFQRASRLDSRDGNLSIRSVTDASGQEHEVLVMSDGRERLLPFVDKSKLSPLEVSTYNSELRALQKLYEDKDPSMLDESGKLDSVEYQRRRQDLYQRFRKKQGSNKASTGTSGTTSEAPKSLLDAPTDPKARTSGEIYQTPLGPLKWTGTGWVTP